MTVGSTDYPWFPLDAEDWNRSTATMTDEQAGAYMRLLCYAWLEHGLPNDEPKIRAIGRWGTAAWRRIWSVVGPKWVPSGDRLINERMEIERTAAGAIQKERSASGKKGAAARWQTHGSANGKAIAEPMANGQQIDAQRQLHLQPHLQGTGEIVSLSPPREGAFELHPAQIRASASGLYAAWRNVAEAAGLPALAQDPPFSAAVHRALSARPSIDWWADTFRRVGESDYLCGRAAGRDGTPFGPVGFWWVIETIERAEKIHGGHYRNRERRAKNADALSDALKELA